MDKAAYPQSFYFSSDTGEGVKEKWESTWKRILLASRSYPELSKEAIIDKYTENWEEKEKYNFIQWFKAKKRGDDKKYKKFEIEAEADYKGHNMIHYAAVIDLGSEEELKELKQKLRSRVESADRVLHKIYDRGLLGDSNEGAKKVEYLSNILQKVKNEILTLKRPELVTARCNRASKLFKKAGFDEGACLLEGAQEDMTEYNNNKKNLKLAATSPEMVAGLEKVRDYLISETKVLSFDRIKNLTKIIDYFDKHDLNLSEPLKSAINTLLKPLDSATNDIYEVISALNKMLVK